jgi:hypothetical protein
MKTVAGFFIGIAVCLLLVLTISHHTSTAKADDNPATLPDGTDLNTLIPDVDNIYREALGGPYRQVASEITDPDIARYYHNLMDKTGLDKIGTQ